MGDAAAPATPVSDGEGVAGQFTSSQTPQGAGMTVPVHVLEGECDSPINNLISAGL